MRFAFSGCKRICQRVAERSKYYLTVPLQLNFRMETSRQWLISAWSRKFTMPSDGASKWGRIGEYVALRKPAGNIQRSPRRIPMRYVNGFFLNLVVHPLLATVLLWAGMLTKSK